MVRCEVCGREFKHLGALAIHVTKLHMSCKEYYNQFLQKDPNEGKCLVCGKETPFVGLTHGYLNYCSSKCASLDPELTKKKKEAYRKTCLERYGVDNAAKLDKTKSKIRKTWLEKYGVDHPMKNEEVKDKVRQTCLEHYGVDVPAKSKEILQRMKETNLRKYGVENAMQVEEFKQKQAKTFKEHYGCNPAKYYEIQQKRKQTCIERYGTPYAMQSEEVKKKVKDYFKEKYGKHPMQLESTKTKVKETFLKRYGVTCIAKAPEIRKKIKLKHLEKFVDKLHLYLKELNLQLLDEEYHNCYYKHRWRCLKCGHEFTQMWNSIQQGYLCPKCYPRPISKPQEDLTNFIESLGFEIIKNDKKLIAPFELDIVIPVKRTAIEYNGLYWHNEEFVGKDYHLQKTQLCEEKQYQLIHIFEDEWVLKKDIVKTRLKHILGKTEDLVHIGARECVIREISVRDKNTFLEQFHIQGKDVSKVRLGAFYQDQLVAVMTFSKGNIAKGSKAVEGVWELNRFCTHSNFVIPGIAGKLLGHFKKNYKWKEIYSYADRRWSNGNLYKQLGFELIGLTQPNYWYVRDIERIHRFSLRKRPDEPKDIPEHLLRLEEGYKRIWDCGSLKFKLMKGTRL